MRRLRLRAKNNLPRRKPGDNRNPFFERVKRELKFFEHASPDPRRRTPDKIQNVGTALSPPPLVLPDVELSGNLRKNLCGEAVGEDRIAGSDIDRNLTDVRDSRDSARKRSNMAIPFRAGWLASRKVPVTRRKRSGKEGLKTSSNDITNRTIDNDTCRVSRSFGFESAAAMATEVMRNARAETLGVPVGTGPVKLKGEDPGFMTTTAALAGGDANSF
jgi:hypothetical protein